jgi:hypothetical protein
MQKVLEASLAYAAIVFGVGFALGTVRILLVVPHLGARWAELLELPLMLVACFLAARFVTQRGASFSRRQCAVVGGISLVFLLSAELGLVLAQGMSLSGYVASRDPVSGIAYLFSLLAFAAMPGLVNRMSAANHSCRVDGPDGPR